MLAIVPVIVMVLGLITTTVFSLKSGLEEEAMDGLELLRVGQYRVLMRILKATMNIRTVDYSRVAKN